MRGVSIAYGDVAPEAKENFNIEVSEKKFDTIRNLQKYNMQLNNYANPCEMYQTVLDGTTTALPSSPSSIGLWSEQLSNDDGTFTTPITITLTSEGQYSSQGFTFTFDKFNEIYPTRLTIQWLRITDEGIEDLSGEMEFNPTSAMYFCRNQVENFNKVVIKFYALNMPKNRLKLEVIDYGYGTVFYGDELRNVKISQSIDPISSEIKIDTCDFTLDSHTDMIYSFQSKQALSISFNDVLLATMFVKSSKRKAKSLWEINAEDYISVLDATPFVGGMYTDTAAIDILDEIFNVAKVPYSINEDLRLVLQDKKLSGHIPYTTCRAALMQVCFASMAVVNTANASDVEIKLLSDTISQEIPLNRIMQGQNFDNGETVTQIDLTAHTYKAIDEVLEAYKAEDDGTGTNIFVTFSEPLHDLQISNGEILSSGANYAYINANEGCVLSGRKYEHTQRIHSKRNPVILASDNENVKSITSATLVSNSNASEVLAHCYEWLVKTEATNLKIVVGKDVERRITKSMYGSTVYGEMKYGEVRVEEIVTNQQDVNVGDLIEAQTEYLGNITGRIIQQSYNLNGNIIVKEAVIK